MASLTKDLRDRAMRVGYFSGLREQALALRKILDGYFGPGASDLVFMQKDSFVYYDPVALYRQMVCTVISAEMLRAHEGAFRTGSRVIYRTGWESLFGDPDFYERHPSLTPEAAQWIADRGVALLGMDTPSPAEDSKASRRSSVSRASAVSRFTVTCRAKVPEKPVLPSSTMSQTGSKRRRPAQENCHIFRSGIPRAAIAR